MSTANPSFWHDLAMRSRSEESDLARDVEGRTEFNLREAIAESIRVCGREYTKEIIEMEMEHG